MKKKNLLKLLGILVLLVSIILFTRWNSEFNKNNRYLTNKLLSGLPASSGKAGELFDFDYDRVYVFRPYQSKEEMEEELGFKLALLEPSLNENMMNILFVKDNSPIAYLYGYGSNKGYYLDLEIGNFSKADLEGLSYKIEEFSLGNSSGPEKTYLNYSFDF